MAKMQPRVFRTSVFLSLTIGVPFCVFKFLFGLLAYQNGYILSGAAVVLWSVTDLFMNFVCIAKELLRASKPDIEFCFLAQLGRKIGKASLLLTVDTFLSFTIICFVLWSGWIKDLSEWGAYMWYGATTINLMSLAMVNVFIEVLADPDRAQITQEKG